MGTMGAIMGFRVIIALLFSIGLYCAWPMSAVAQGDSESAPTIFRVEVGGPYQLKDSYSILYDNTAQSAKLKNFRVIFYGTDGQILTETETEIHPLDSNIETYGLSGPVIGFSEIGLSVISLHSGDIAGFPAEVGNIVGMDRTEIPKPTDPDANVETPEENATLPPVAIPTLSNAEKQRVTNTGSDISEFLEALRVKSAEFTQAQTSRAENDERLNQLIQNTAALLKRTDSPALPDLKPQIDALSAEMIAARTAATLTDEQELLTQLETQVSELEAQVESLNALAKTEGADITNVMTTLTEIETKLSDLDRRAAETALPEGVTAAQLQVWDAAFLDLETQINASPSNWKTLLAAVLAGLAVLGLGGKFLLSSNAKAKPLKSVLNRAETPGVIFPASPMLAGNVAAPLAPAGKLAAAQLQMLSGPYAVLRDAYEATGRIGYAQEGVPSAEDYAFGTGFLVSDRHVVTNRHVHGLYGHYLLDKSEPGGIEFIAEKGKPASDFVPFNGEPPLLLPALDIAIYTLSRAVKNRTPIALTAVDTDALDKRDIIVVGYPDTHTPEKSEILAVVEENPVFAVKRLSQGQIFRHSTDTDTPYGIKTSVTESKSSAFEMPAICHNASTLPGNSGSPLLDIKDGTLLGVHFAGFKVFNSQEAANLAMAIAQLTEADFEKDLQA